jgi:predicted dehydrogenase
MLSSFRVGVMEPVLFWIVGGYAADHLKVASEDEGLAKISAVVVRGPEKYPKEADYLRSRSVTIHNIFDEMIDAEKGRTEIITLPAAICKHEEITIKVLKHRFNVIVEKPPAVTIQDLNGMLDAERRSGKFCAVSFQLQSKAVVRKIRETICGGNG